MWDMTFCIMPSYYLSKLSVTHFPPPSSLPTLTLDICLSLQRENQRQFSSFIGWRREKQSLEEAAGPRVRELENLKEGDEAEEKKKGERERERILKSE